MMSSSPPSKILILGLSGPSSSGKTTLARLLRRIFTTAQNSTTKLFIIHEDDFYKTDKLIPRKTFTSQQFGTRELDDWDCVESLDLPLLRRELCYVKEHGTLSEDFASKEDQNSVGESGVSEEQVSALQRTVEAFCRGDRNLTICLLDGFLLYPDPKSEDGSQERELYEILQPLLSLKIFLPSTREQTIRRRTQRTGYVTLEGFWEDPPGYVEDVVWPNFARDHAWLFGNENGSEAADEGRVEIETAAKSGILVGPGHGEVHLRDILPWAVQKIKGAVEELEK